MHICCIEGEMVRVLNPGPKEGVCGVHGHSVRLLLHHVSLLELEQDNQIGGLK
jgi:hypothetical protein